MPLNTVTVLSLDPTGETYSFVERDKAAVTHVATGVMKRFIKESPHTVPVIRCEFSDTLRAAFKRGDLGVEVEHAMSLSEDALNVPGMIGDWGDSHIMLDGAHRVWRRMKRGDADFLAYIIPEFFWREFVVTDVPGDVDFWDDFNRNAKIRTPEFEFLRKLLGGL